MESSEEKFIPGSDADANDIFRYPFTVEADSIHFIKNHGRIMFIIRGLPGTGKNSLCDMLVDRYPTSKVCSADDYFTETFSSTKRDPDSLKVSHEYCQRRVQNACSKGVHPIIVKNTHVVKYEMQKYLNFAAEFNYTIIMALTVNKFKMTPEILAKSNTKGLSVDYFQRRLTQWEEVTPVNTGWFLGLNDSTCLLSKLQVCLDHLLGDGKFCRVINAYEKDDLLKKYEVRKELYVIAACGPRNLCNEIKFHCLSKEVYDCYGQVFPITVQGFLVTPSYIAAVVHLDDKMKQLYFIKQKSSPRYGSLVDSFNSLNLGENFMGHCKTTEFVSTDVPEEEKPVRQPNLSCLNVHQSCYMIVAEKATRRETLSPTQLVNQFSGLLRGVANGRGEVAANKFMELDDKFLFCRLSEDAWLIKSPALMSFKSIFTGIYV